MSKTKRIDIQILRAIAIISVLDFHFKVFLYKNGYLGVDIFFVISGYLITKKIVESSYSNNFAFTEFYKSRFKRLYPSLVSSSLFTIFIGLFNLNLDSFYELLRGIKYSLFFIGNIFFSQTSNYFEIATDQNLIINLWSLSVEEQFYIIYPIFIYLAFKFKRLKIENIILITFLASLIFLSKEIFEFFYFDRIFFTFENYLFYSPFARAYQILIGCVVFFIKQKYQFRNQLIRIFLLLMMQAFLTGLLTMYSNFLIALVTGLILLFKNDFINKFYISPFLFIGNISYSLYLFHQPIIAGINNHNFYTTEFGSKKIDLNNFNISLVILLFIFFVSYLNYRFIESYYLKNFKIVLPATKVYFLVLTFLVISVIKPVNFTRYAYSESENIESQSFEKSYKLGTNFLIDVENNLCLGKDTIESACKFGKGDKEIYFLGDSIISSIISGFIVNDRLSDFNFVEYTQPGCYSLYGLCNFLENKLYFQEINNIKNSIVVLGGTVDDEVFKNDNLIKTIQLFVNNENKVIIFGYFPERKINNIMFYRKYGFFMDDTSFTLDSINKNKNLNIFVNKLISENFLDGRVIFLDVISVLCPNESCINKIGDKFIYTDRSHISYYGAEFLIKKLAIDKKLDSLSQ